MQLFSATDHYHSLGAADGAANGPVGADDGNGNTGMPSASSGSMSDMFTKLLVAQIQNQDPLEPMKPEQFVTQLTQMSQVEAMQNMAALSQVNSAMLESMLVVSLGGQVGSNVMVKTDAVDLDGSTAVHGAFNLDASADSTTVTVTGSDGVPHKIDLGAQKAGEVKFDIDPAQLGLPAGRYTVAVQAGSGDAGTAQTPSVEIEGKLQSVRLGDNGQVILSVAGIGDVTTADITRFLGNPGSAPDGNPDHNLKPEPRLPLSLFSKKVF
ncbi:flagellar hook capping FlgD N-terminal domain-containing protein [Trinickia mobilis]|uniref:flagellar hook capping FlgD N-terminal domain-containing protein n=1 Tax=Trinickia mobilis TaxID=2816356 RepID=UPI001A908FC9|nr:flagellar hook capping FlgD N-terminal domain-containing protein [Trinickia mobilis]